MDKGRLKILNLTIIGAYLLVLSRIFYWQIIKYSDFKQRIIDQSYKASVIKPSRGLIYDSQSEPIVLNKTLLNLSVYKPDLKQDPKEIIPGLKSVNPALSAEDISGLEKFFNNSNQKWLTLKTLFDSAAADKFPDPGLIYSRLQTRFYPEGNLGKLILGNTTTDNEGNMIPLGGLESYYQRQLQGKTGFSWETKDATGKTLLSKTGWQIDAVNGRDLFTSLNREVQYHIEQSLKKGIETFSADSGSITVMQPQTGDIIAMASFVATGSAVSTPSATRNLVISDLFEPGSIFKPLVMSMALDSRTIDTNFICTKCDRPHQIGEYSISNWDSTFHADTGIYDIIKNSDNIGMSYIIQTLGLKRFLNYFDALGLDRRTGIDLQAEARPVVKSSWPDIDLATASFGQGFAITQIQMLTAFNSIADDGLLVPPHLVSYFREGDDIIKNPLASPKRIYSSETIARMKDILKYAVENGVVAKFKPENLEVCAKSGTSQIAVKGGYSDSSTIASYVGFSPCNHPKFTMIVTINNPKTSPWGSSTAAPIWYEIAEFLSPLL